MLAKSTPAGGGACSRSSSSSSRKQRSSKKQRSSNNRSSSRAAYSRSRAAGRPCGHSCQELPRAGNLCFLTRVSEGTLGLVDYHCRAPFRPSVPWCFPVREVRFFKAICWLKAHQQEEGLVAGAAAAAAGSSSSSRKQRSSNNRSSSQAAYSRSRAAGRPCGHSCQELPRAGNLCF